MEQRGWTYTQASEYLRTPAPVMRFAQLIRSMVAERDANTSTADPGVE